MTLRFDEYCDLQVGLVGNGKLVVAGRPDARVTFTSLLSPPAKGNWYGILLVGNGEATLTYADISYAGSGGGSIGAGALVVEDQASLQMSQVSVKHNAGYGVVIGCDDTHVSIDETTCSFEDNSNGDRGNGPTCHGFIPR
jgi:hypothetical protein